MLIIAYIFFFKLSEISRPKFDYSDMSVKNEDDNPSLILKENSLPCVKYFCSGQSHVPSKQYYEAESASYACPTKAQGKF